MQNCYYLGRVHDIFYKRKNYNNKLFTENNTHNISTFSLFFLLWARSCEITQLTMIYVLQSCKQKITPPLAKQRYFAGWEITAATRKCYWSTLERTAIYTLNNEVCLSFDFDASFNKTGTTFMSTLSYRSPHKVYIYNWGTVEKVIRKSSCSRELYRAKLNYGKYSLFLDKNPFNFKCRII